MHTAGLTKQLLPEHTVLLVALAVSHRRLGEAAGGDLGGDVGAGERRAADAEALLNDVGEDVDVTSVDVDSLVVSGRKSWGTRPAWRIRRHGGVG